ncbi:MAG: hypothetical protein ACK4NR_09155 [Micavibrio sp.]
MKKRPDLVMVRDRIIVPALVAIDSYSKAAERLVLATGLAESGYLHVRQVARYKPGGGVAAYGPARGYFQMEPATHDDLWANYLGATRRANLLEGLRKITDHPGDPEEMVRNPQYAAAMCRIFYLRIRAPLPAENDLRGMAEYWKRYYNTRLGKGTVEGFMEKAAEAMSL